MLRILKILPSGLVHATCRKESHPAAAPTSPPDPHTAVVVKTTLFESPVLFDPKCIAILYFSSLSLGL